MRKFLTFICATVLAMPALAQSQAGSNVGSPAPARADQIAGRDASGNLRVPTVDPSGNLSIAPKSNVTIATAQVAVGTTATLIAAARTGRFRISVTVTTAVQCAFGNSGVTLATGWPLAAVAYASDSWDTQAALYGVCASAATVADREIY